MSGSTSMDNTTANSNVPYECITSEEIKAFLKDVDDAFSSISYQLEEIIYYIARKKVDIDDETKSPFMIMRLSIENLCELLPAVSCYKENADCVNNTYCHNDIALVCNYKRVYKEEYAKQYRSVYS